jgi:phosphate-selective porin OprO/OprP
MIQPPIAASCQTEVVVDGRICVLITGFRNQNSVRVDLSAISITSLALAMLIVAPCSAWESGDTSGFDKIWSYATLYQNDENPHIQKFALSGRLQADSVWVDSDQGNFSDVFVWRRFRFGFKADLFREWVVHLEGDYDLNESLGEVYSRLTDAYIGWNPNEYLKLKLFKQSAGFTLDGATSSKRLLTLERNNLSNNLWFTTEYFTGLTARGSFDKAWAYQAGVFSSDPNDELSHFDAGYFVLLSLSRRLVEIPELSKSSIRLDYVYNSEDANAATRDFSNVLSLVTTWDFEPWGVRTDLSTGTGYGGQSDVWGVVVMPYYDFNRHIQAVLRYTYVSSAENNGVRLTRYANRVVTGRGDEYNEFYAGVNVYFYGHKLKWQSGVEYASMDDDANDGGEYEGWQLITGLRLYW